MKYFVELLDSYEETLQGKLYPINPRGNFFDEQECPHTLRFVEDTTGYVVDL